MKWSPSYHRTFANSSHKARYKPTKYIHILIYLNIYIFGIIDDAILKTSIFFTLQLGDIKPKKEKLQHSQRLEMSQLVDKGVYCQIWQI